MSCEFEQQKLYAKPSVLRQQTSFIRLSRVTNMDLLVSFQSQEKGHDTYQSIIY